MCRDFDKLTLDTGFMLASADFKTMADTNIKEEVCVLGDVLFNHCLPIVYIVYLSVSSAF